MFIGTWVSGYTELIPEVIEQPEGVMKKGKFEPFDGVIQRLGPWVTNNQVTIRVYIVNYFCFRNYLITLVKETI